MYNEQRFYNQSNLLEIFLKLLRPFDDEKISEIISQVFVGCVYIEVGRLINQHFHHQLQLCCRESLNFLNMNMSICKIYSIEAIDVHFDTVKIESPFIENQPFPFWIDFNITVVEISFFISEPKNGSDDNSKWCLKKVTFHEIKDITIR